MFRRGGSDEVAHVLAAHTPLRRIAQADEIDDLAVWLWSDEARFVTGQSLLVDAGFTMGGPR